MPSRDVTLADEIALLEKIENQSLPTGGDNWGAEVLSCTRYTAARETAR
jgi:hypothetical protein